MSQTPVKLLSFLNRLNRKAQKLHAHFASPLRTLCLSINAVCRRPGCHLSHDSGRTHGTVRAAGLGPRVRHHRFPDTARSEDNFACGTSSLPGSTDAMTFRRIRRAVALGIQIILCIIRFQLLRFGGPRTLERRAYWVQQTARAMLASLDIAFQSRQLLLDKHPEKGNHTLPPGIRPEITKRPEIAKLCGSERLRPFLRIARKLNELRGAGHTGWRSRQFIIPQIHRA